MPPNSASYSGKRASQSDSGRCTHAGPEMKCAACGKELDKPKFCARCKKVAYCGAECQKAHWKTHKNECAAAAAAAAASGAAGSAAPEPSAEEMLRVRHAITTVERALQEAADQLQARNLDGAEALLQHTLVTAESSLGPFSRTYAARIYYQLGAARSARSSIEDAERCFRKALELLDSGHRSEEDERTRAKVAATLCGVMLARGQAADAERLVVGAIEQLQRVLPGEHALLCRLLDDLADTYVARSMKKQAEDAYVRASAEARKCSPVEALACVRPVYRGLVGLYVNDDRIKEADELILRLRNQASSSTGPAGGASSELRLQTLVVVVELLVSEAKALRIKGKQAECIVRFREAANLSSSLASGAHQLSSEVHMNLGIALSETENKKEAESVLRRAVQLYTESVGRDSMPTAVCMLQLGKVQLAMDKAAAAAETLAQCANVAERATTRENQVYGSAQYLLGAARVKLNALQEAQAAFHAALESARLSKDGGRQLECFEALEDLYNKMKQPENAKRCREGVQHLRRIMAEQRTGRGGGRGGRGGRRGGRGGQRGGATADGALPEVREEDETVLEEAEGDEEADGNEGGGEGGDDRDVDGDVEEKAADGGHSAAVTEAESSAGEEKATEASGKAQTAPKEANKAEQGADREDEP
jgi:tetratricopeptide (TPR) repeat protein